MATGSLGAVNFTSPVSLGCTMPANTYPNGSITLSNMSQGNAYWIQSSNCEPGVVHTWTIYICDSAGNNAHSIGTFQVTGQSGWYSNAVFTSSFSVSGATDLVGKALYMKASCNKSGVTGGSLEHRGTSSVTINTAVNSYALTVQSNNTSYGTVSGGGSYSPGASVSISASPKTGYHFTSWTATAGTIASATSASTTYTMPSSNATVTGSFAINTYTVTVNGTANTWNYNSSHTITAPAAPTGKYFSGWTMSGYGSISSPSSSTTTFTVGLGNAVVTANYAWTYYTVSKASSPSAGGTVSVGKTSAHYGEVITVGATPSTGYQLSSWSTNVAGTTVSNSKFTMPNSNITVTGNFSKINYSITMRANPNGGGSPTASKSTANYGDSITVSNNRSSGYLFDGWTSSDVTITNNAFTMPAKNVTITGNYHIGRSTASVDKTSVTPGDVITLTINAEQSSFYHKYKLSFGLGMETDLTTVSAGTSTVEIYIPLAWSRMMKTMQKTGGTLTVYTYESDNSLLGEYVIDSLTYNAMNGIIPKLTIRRADDAETLNVKGTKARYTIAVPAGIDSYTLACNSSSVENPTKNGLILPENTMTFATDTSVVVTLTIVFGSETFTLTESVPSVWLLSKSVG